ncbi:hypothetical protein N0V88_005817 [Collariella sp. IMI 366227]|nr:hypothetical protein N0V88_005817 [Collariella sp. IMI 366227]
MSVLADIVDSSDEDDLLDLDLDETDAEYDGPALELLARFHHRNKNQHRLSKWWAQADMLRRHLRKMVEELEDGLVKAEGRAFTQLTADRQFAHLGLMLLGVLAQVDQALTPFAPSPSQQNLGSDGDDYDGAAQLKRKETSTTKKRRVVGGDEFDDIFGGLSDDERGKSSKTKAKTKSGGGKKKKAAGDEFDDIFGAEAGEKKRKKRKESGEDNGGAVKAAIKKKKKVGGDEFDDIFGGMDDDGGKKVKAKKKVGKKRDEFDDIFGGL